MWAMSKSNDFSSEYRVQAYFKNEFITIQYIYNRKYVHLLYNCVKQLQNNHYN